MTTEVKQFEDNMTGILGTNDFKKESKHPDKRGRAKIHGIWFWISGWTKTSNNRTFDSLSFTEMTADEAAKVEASQAAKRAPQTQGSFNTPQGQSQQQQPQNHVAQNEQGQPLANQQPPADFDDDIPF